MATCTFTESVYAFYQFTTRPQLALKNGQRARCTQVIADVILFLTSKFNVVHWLEIIIISFRFPFSVIQEFMKSEPAYLCLQYHKYQRKYRRTRAEMHLANKELDELQEVDELGMGHFGQMGPGARVQGN